MAGTAASEALGAQIRSEAAACGGVLPFVRFMELALYAPGLGYYERGRAVVGRGGDFYTSASVGPVFGELLAFRFARWQAEDDGPAGGASQIIEAGAHDGRLARDILAWLRIWRPALAGRIRYTLCEPSSVRRAWQAETLAGFSGQVDWISDIREARSGRGGIRGVVFANELLDAFAVHRLGWDAASGRWFEWGVEPVDEGFRWARVASGKSAVPEAAWPRLPGGLLGALPDGFTTEVCPAASAWWRDATDALDQGRLLTFDYGLRVEEFFLPQRAGGTLRGYQRHRSATDLLAGPGDQDLTSQVDFSALVAVGEQSGATTECFTTQRRWLTEAMAETLAPDAGFAAWDASRVRQFQTLTHPEHLGRAFSVLCQRKRVSQ